MAPSTYTPVPYELWPRPQEVVAPEYLPDKVKGFYLQGINTYRQHFDESGMVFRKALDAALKDLDPKGKGSLYERINKLPEATGVTPAMKEWAHEIRDLGNDAAHEDDQFTKEEAETLQAFTELFLRYAFTLPGMLNTRKAQLTATS